MDVEAYLESDAGNVSDKKFFVVQMQLKPHVAGTVNEVIVTMG